MTDTPLSHGKAVCLIKIDRVSSNQSRSIIVDDVFLVCIGDPETCPEWKARPIGRGAHHAVAGKAFSDGVTRSAFFRMRIGSSSHALRALCTRDVRFLRGTANNETSASCCHRKVKALRHGNIAFSIAAEPAKGKQ